MRWTALVFCAACASPAPGTDAGRPDASTMDAQVADASTMDAQAADASTPDARASEDAAADSAPPPACDPSQAFAFASFGGLATGLDELVVLPTPDLLSVYVTRNTSGNFDVYFHTRATLDADFGAAGEVAELNTAGDDVLSWLSPDRLTAYLTRAGDIAVATRASASAPFGAPVVVADVSGTGNDIDPFLARSGTLYFASDRGGDFALYSAAPAAGGRFATPVLIGELDTGAAEVRPVLTDDERTIYFTRAGVLLSAARDSRLMPFGSAGARPDLVSEPNSTTLVSWVSGDGCRLVLTTDGIVGPAGLEPFLFLKP
ncbi:MAG: PD40 domain-containing protein [Sandaracinaceae bacterium]|nr:PD40 domain-containing protein [Sandaracinaceae bacterium]